MSTICEIDNQIQNHPIADPMLSPTGTLSDAWLGIRTLGDPVLRLAWGLHTLPLPAPSFEEVHDALIELGRFDRYEIQEISGLPSWLHSLRDPYAGDEPLGDWDRPTADDAELSRTIRAAIPWAEAGLDDDLYGGPRW